MFHLLAYLQDEWLSCKILARQRVILQDLARFWKKILQDDVSSCNILPESCKILQDNHSLSNGGVTAKCRRKKDFLLSRSVFLDQYFSSEKHVLSWLITTDHVLFQALRLAKSWPRLAQDLPTLCQDLPENWQVLNKT